MTAYPCSICTKKVQQRHKAILCDICDKWTHIKCNLLDDKDYNYHKKHQDAHFSCRKCIENFLPYSTLNDNQFDMAVKQGVNYLLDTDVNILNRTKVDKKLFERINKTISQQNNGENDDGSDDGIQTHAR